MVKLQDLARQLNLSVSTVSRALARHPEIREETGRRVRALADELGYQPNQLAANLRKRQSQTIGVIVPYLRDNFFVRVMHGIEAAATAQGYQMLVCQSGDDEPGERRALARLRQAGVAGVLLSVAGASSGPVSCEAVHALPSPLVFFDRRPAEGPPVNAAVIDDRLGRQLATQHLLAQNYRCIARLTGPAHLHIYRQRQLGYADALARPATPYHPNWCWLATCARPTDRRPSGSC